MLQSNPNIADDKNSNQKSNHELSSQEPNGDEKCDSKRSGIQTSKSRLLGARLLPTTTVGDEQNQIESMLR
jgi:hypothetical protein